MHKFMNWLVAALACSALAAIPSFAEGLDPVDLPIGYEQLEYVESSTGAECLDTGVAPDGSTTCTFGFSYRGSETESVFLLGSRKAFQDSAFYFSHQRKGEEPKDGLTCSCGNSIVYSQFHPTTYQVASLTVEKKFTLNGSEFGDLSAAAFESDYPIYLFALNNAGTVKDGSKMRLYFCDIYKGGTLVRSFVPARQYGITIGLYDRVESKFYRPARSALSAGPAVGSQDLRPLPAGYRYVEYVSSSGHELLDTEIVPDSATEMRVRLRPHDSKDVHMVGSRTAYQELGFGLSNNSGLTMAYGTQVKAVSGPHVNEMVTVMLSNCGAYFGDTVCATFDAETFAGIYPIYAFTVNNGGSPHNQFATIDLAELLIVTNGVPARDFAAVKDESGTPGLHDFVSGRFFTCAQGTLTAGPEVVVVESLEPSDIRCENEILSMHVTRKGSSMSAADVTLAFGSVIGGSAAAEWEGQCAAGAFASGQSEIQISVGDLPQSARYARLFTASSSSQVIEIYRLVGRYVPPSLPAGYRAVDDLRTGQVFLDGGYVIDTGYVHKRDTRIECVAAVDRGSAQDNGWAAVFGTRLDAAWINGGGYAFFTCDNHLDVPRFNRSGDKVVGAADSFPYGAKVRIVAETNTVTWSSEPSGELLGSLVTTARIDDGFNTMAIFDLNDSPTAGGFRTSCTPASMKLYSFRMIDEGFVSRDFVPCLNEYGEPGLYETIGGTFHGNHNQDQLPGGRFVDSEKDPEKLKSCDFETDLPTTRATYTWTGAGTSASWSDAANWSRSSEDAAEVPGWSSTVVFPAGRWTVKLDRKVGIRTLDASAADLTLRFAATVDGAELLVRDNLKFGAVSDVARQGLWFDGGAVRVAGSLVPATGAGALPLHFTVPKGGFAVAPLRFADAGFKGSVRGRVFVDPKSPALRVSGATTSPLVASGVDMATGNLTLEPLPKRHPEKDGAYAWRGNRNLDVTLEGYSTGMALFIR